MRGTSKESEVEMHVDQEMQRQTHRETRERELERQCHESSLFDVMPGLPATALHESVSRQDLTTCPNLVNKATTLRIYPIGQRRGSLG